MHVIYKCRCTKDEITIAVPDRRPKSDVVPWMKMVEHCVSVDHTALSPLCISKRMQYLKIPVEAGTPGGVVVGAPVAKN